ncbi:MAG: type II secretion system inner membrane protein GspF [Pseudomonadales bacterium]|nr:type II secretion system inner membrane protein GspF [Pseudomonadales bacterium]
MAAYHYVALDSSGRQKKGVDEGDTARHVRQQLRDRGWTPLEVHEVLGKVRRTKTSVDSTQPAADKSEKKQQAQSKNLFNPTISIKELALITRQLATLTRAALPLDESLATVVSQSGKDRVKKVMTSVRAQVVEGQSLAQAMSNFPKVFKQDYVATVRAGEQSGDLAGVLDRLADYTENGQKIRQTVSNAMLYPIILTVVAVMVVVGMLTYVVPQVIEVFAGIDQELPLLTRVLISASDFLQVYGFVLLIVLVLLGALVRWILNKPGPKQRWHTLMLKIPLVGQWLKISNCAVFCRTQATLLASGVPMLDAMRISSEVLSNIPMRASIEEASGRIREGASLSYALTKTDYFPPMTLHLIASGEASGALGDMLFKAAENQERDLESWISTFLAILEPVLILLMGGLVMMIVLAIMMPIFELNQMVS